VTAKPATASPDALLFVAPDCPHCPTVLKGLSELVKEGLIGRLEVVNVFARPDLAVARGVRSVPWLLLGGFALEGLRSPAELRRWAERAGTSAGTADYFRELLESGGLQQVIDMVRKDTDQLDALLLLLADPDTELPVRVGIGAVMEEFQGQEPLQARADRLGELTRSPDAHIRGDACHYLALSRSPRALHFIRPLAQDPERQVREIAQEAIEALESAGST